MNNILFGAFSLQYVQSKPIQFDADTAGVPRNQTSAQQMPQILSGKPTILQRRTYLSIPSQPSSRMT